MKSSGKRYAWVGLAPRLAGVAVVIFVWSLGPQALAAGSINPLLEEKIQATIDQRHPTDTADWWRALGPDAVKTIIAMYDQTSQVYPRIRLIQGLGWFDDPDAVAFIKNQADNATDDVVRNASITSLSLSQGSREDDFIAKFLDNNDPQTRMTAALALKHLPDDPHAEELLIKYLASEKQGWIRDRVTREPAVPLSAPLKITSRQERKLAPEFDGSWTGLWLQPRRAASARATPPNGMRSDPVTVELELDDDGILSGELKVKLKPDSGPGPEKVYTYKVEKIIGKDAHITGILSRATPKPKDPNAKITMAFDAELAQRDKLALLHVVIPEVMGTLVLKKDAN